MKTEFYKPYDSKHDSIKKNAIELKELCEALIKKSAAVSVYTGTVLTPLDIIKARRSLSSNGELGNTFKNITLNTIVSAFESGHAMRSHLTTWLMAIACIDSDWDISFSKITSKSSRINVDELHEFASKWCSDDETLNLFKKSITMAGASSSISIEESPFSKTRVIQSSGFKLPFTLPSEFWSAVLKKKIEVLDSKIILIDGVITTVGEIHGILNQSFETKEPIFIFARGFGEEVIGTMIQNYKLGKLNAFPVILPLGTLSNILYDISEIIDTSVISVINGEILSNVNLSDKKPIPLIRMDEQNLIIFNPENNNTKNVIKKIRNEFKEISLKHDEYAIDMESSYNARLNFLSNKRIEILIGKNSITPPGVLKDRLQTLFSVYNEMVETGIIRIKDIKDDIPKSLYDSFNRCGIEFLPSATFCYAISAATSKQKLLKNTEKFLLIDI